jgi:hypothetical protein
MAGKLASALAVIALKGQNASVHGAALLPDGKACSSTSRSALA